MEKELVKLNKELLNSSKRVHSISEELWEYAHLQLKDADLLKKVEKNPLADLSDYNINNPDEHLLSIMMNPDYFGWTCSKLFNTAISENGLELLPMQCVILKELWNHSLPILLASRGGSKTFMLGLYSILRALFLPGRKIVITGAGFRQSKLVMAYAELLWYNSPILRDICGARYDKNQGPHHNTDVWELNIGTSSIKALPIGSGEKIRGTRANDILVDEFSCVKSNTLIETSLGLMRIEDSFKEKDFSLFTGDENILEKPSKFIKTPLTDVYKIITVGGYEFSCSSIHQVETPTGWKLAKDLKKNDMLIFDNQYKFPKEYIKYDDVIVDENLGWLMGILISEGAINDKYNMTVNMTSKDCIDRIFKAWKTLDCNLNPRISSKKSYIDDRGWKCKECWHVTVCNIKLREKLVKLGLERNTVKDKKIPWSILRSPKSVVVAFLAGLWEGDGTAYINKNKENSVDMTYYSSSEQLCYEVQILLKKLDILSFRNFRNTGVNNSLGYFVSVGGQNSYHLINLLNVRKWDDIINNCKVPDPNIGQRNVSFNKNKKSKNWEACIQLYGKMKWLGYFDTKEEAYNRINQFKLSIKDWVRVKSVEKLTEQDYLYDYYLPKSHSFYGNGFRHHNSIPPQIFEEVIAGFAAVNIDPIEQVKHRQRMQYLKDQSGSNFDINNKSFESKDSGIMGNQIIMSGTASFAFNHFCHYWKRNKDVILSGGDPVKMERKGIDPKTDVKEYCIIRIPVELLPPGFMSEEMVNRSKNTMSSGIYLNEFGACFAEDSTGFFRRSIIEKAVPSDRNPVILSTGTVIDPFSTMLKGDPNKKYVMAIDPASQRDNFAVVILETYSDHARVVYCWTTNAETHTELRKLGNTKEMDFYAFCLRKVRDLMRLFNIIHIAIDSQGGGRTISELFHNDKYLQPGEHLIWELDSNNPLWDGHARETDNETGLHILELVNFRNTQYTPDANHGLKHDLEQKLLVFPYIDAIDIVLAGKNDLDEGRTFDTAQEVLMEIEELKNELTMIIHAQTPTGVEKWGAPNAKSSSDSTIGKIFDDRYSALLMANSAARRLRVIPQQEYQYAGGGFSNTLSKSKSREVVKNAPLYVGPSWFTDAVKGTSGYWTDIEHAETV